MGYRVSTWTWTSHRRLPWGPEDQRSSCGCGRSSRDLSWCAWLGIDVCGSGWIPYRNRSRASRFRRRGRVDGRSNLARAWGGAVGTARQRRMGALSSRHRSTFGILVPHRDRDPHSLVGERSSQPRSQGSFWSSCHCPVHRGRDLRRSRPASDLPLEANLVDPATTASVEQHEGRVRRCPRWCRGCSLAWVIE